MDNDTKCYKCKSDLVIRQCDSYGVTGRRYYVEKDSLWYVCEDDSIDISEYDVVLINKNECDTCIKINKSALHEDGYFEKVED